VDLIHRRASFGVNLRPADYASSLRRGGACTSRLVPATVHAPHQRLRISGFSSTDANARTIGPREIQPVATVAVAAGSAAFPQIPALAYGGGMRSMGRVASRWCSPTALPNVRALRKRQRFHPPRQLRPDDPGHVCRMGLYNGPRHSARTGGRLHLALLFRAQRPRWR